MAIYRLLQGSAFEPEAIERMATAYEDVLRKLQLASRSDPITEIIAKKILDIAQTGERDPARMAALALTELGIPLAE